MVEVQKPDIRPGRLTPDTYAENFSDLHPPLDRHEALVEADRCYFCYDAPCVTACPTAIDIPLFIREILTDKPQGGGRNDPHLEHPGRHVRPGLPHRDAVRGGLCSRGGRGQAGPHRRASALCHRHLDGRRHAALHPVGPDRQAGGRLSAGDRRGSPALTGLRSTATTSSFSTPGQGLAASTNTASRPTRRRTISPRPRSTSSCRSAA